MKGVSGWDIPCACADDCVSPDCNGSGDGVFLDPLMLNGREIYGSPSPLSGEMLKTVLFQSSSDWEDLCFAVVLNSSPEPGNFWNVLF